MSIVNANLPLDDKVQALEAMAEGKEKMTYTKNLTHEEMDEYRERLSDTLVEIDKHEIDFEVVKQEHRGIIKPLKADVGALLDVIKRRAVDVTEECYLIPDYDSSMMEYYNSEGELIHSRRLKPEERQTTIKPFQSASNNY